MKSVQAILVVFIVILSSHQSAAQLSLKYKTYEQRQARGLQYGLFKPEHYDPGKSYPLVLYLHGANDTISRDIAWYHESIQRDNPLFVLTPKCTNPNQGWGNTWTDAHSPAMAATLQILDSLVGKYNIDKNRLYVYGISMGGFGVFSVLAKEQDKFAAGYAICGGSSETVATQLSDTPLWIFHGDSDDVVPVKLSRQIYEGVKKEGGTKVRYTEYPGVRHNSWENASREKTLHRWLLAQSKNKLAETPYPPQKISAHIEDNSTVLLTWGGSKPDQDIWYYKLYRDNILITEIDGGTTSFPDNAAPRSATHQYYLVAVNYNFKESKRSVTARVVVP